MKPTLHHARLATLLILLAGAGALALAGDTADYQDESRWTPEARGAHVDDGDGDPTRRGRSRDNRPWWEGNSGSDDDSRSSSDSSGKSGSSDSDDSGQSGKSSSDSSSEVSPTDPDDDSSSD